MKPSHLRHLRHVRPITMRPTDYYNRKIARALAAQEENAEQPSQADKLFNVVEALYWIVLISLAALSWICIVDSV